jgi:D-sedoheptulose 7-phosphate isomerase
VSAGPEGTDFLYPFIEGDETDSSSLLTDLGTSARNKWKESAALRQRTLEQSDPMIREVAAAMAERFVAGGRLFAFGNGGSATDADGVAHLYTAPPWGTPLPARSLVEDHAVLTALSNDIGFDVVFARQIAAFGRRGDIAVGLSTSGNSANLIRAFDEAARLGMVTDGLAGYDGGRMAEADTIEHLFVVPSASVHRIQEAQTSVYHVLWELVQFELGELADVRAASAGN